MIKHIKQRIATGNYSLKASQGKQFHSQAKDIEQNPLEEICKHNDYCNLRLLKNKEKCYNPIDTKTCQSFKFYNKFGKDYMKMFIGGKE